MPKRIAWQDTALGIDDPIADAVLDRMKSYEITKSNTMACTMCSDVEPHKMRYRLMECNSQMCESASEFAFGWRGKMVTCLKNDEVSIYTVGEHTTQASSPKKKKLTSTQKAFCRDLAEHHLCPMRIRHAMARKFDTLLEDLPALSTVQNFVNHHARSNLGNNDRVDDVRKWIHSHAYTGEEALTQPFTFGWDLDSEGKPVVGNGSDERPFIVGLTSKALVMKMMLAPERFILHVDATYKMNYREYPVLVVGVSDRSRGFHVVALFVISQETQLVVQPALMALKRLYLWITGRELQVKFAMGDADNAQHNALNAVFGGCDRFKALMCFFHVMKKVYEAIRGFPSGVAASIVHAMYDLHFARSESAYLWMRDRVFKEWMKYPGLQAFAQYMWAQWLTGRYCAWQVYITPGGFASTNNPAETFNALLKRDYTLRRRLKMGALLKELRNCCEEQSSNPRPFRFEVVPAATLVRHVSELVREKLLGTCEGGIVENLGAGRIKVYSLLAKRIIVAPNKRSELGIAVSAQMGANYARMEVQGQPWGGWVVDMYHKWCGCNYFYAFGVCIHVLFAIKSCDHIDSQGCEVLVSRKKRKRGGAATGTSNVGGRPSSVGSALTF